MTKRFELRLCSNGTYYVYENGALTDVDFDKFNKESAYALIDKVNALYEEKEQLKVFLKALNEELSLANRDNDTLEEENKQLKKENYELHKRLGDFEPFEEHIKERTSKTSINDIIGLVKTDEPTDIVELEKELSE